MWGILFIQPGKRYYWQEIISSTAGSLSPLLYIKDTLSNCKFLIDTGASVSVFPHSPAKGEFPSNDLKLVSADGSAIKSYGSRILPVRLEGRHITWSFVLAAVDRLSSLMFFACTSALQSLNIRLSTILLLKDHQFMPNLAWKWPGESSKLWKKLV